VLSRLAEQKAALLQGMADELDHRNDERLVHQGISENVVDAFKEQIVRLKAAKAKPQP
jgi:hypothetical protein